MKIIVPETFVSNKKEKRSTRVQTGRATPRHSLATGRSVTEGSPPTGSLFLAHKESDVPMKSHHFVLAQRQPAKEKHNHTEQMHKKAISH
jgi:hypothetical protein